MWSDSASVYIAWDNSEKMIEGVPVWAATRGLHQFLRDDFIGEVVSFHERLMRIMEERVEKVIGGALPSDVHVDYTALKREQEERRKSIEWALAPPVVPTDWQRVASAISEIEHVTKQC